MSHIAVTIAPDTPPDKLVLLAKYCLARAGCTDPVAALAKARGTLKRRRHRAHSEGDAPLSDPALDALWQALEAWGSAWWVDTAPFLEYLVTAPETLEKAWGTQWSWPWTHAQWQRVVRVLRRAGQAFVAHVTGQAPQITLPDIRAIQRSGVLPPTMQDVIGQAATIGRLSVPPPRVGPLPPGPLPLSSAEQAAVDFARRQTGAFLQPLVSAVEARVAARLLHDERQAVHRHVPEAMQTRTSPTALARILADDAGQWQRDWKRVARTEVAHAANWGAMAAMIAQHPSNLVTELDGTVHPVPNPTVPTIRVFRLPANTACDHCVRLYLQGDGAPQLYWLHDLLRAPLNVGLSAAQWQAQVGTTHPSCVCGPWVEYVSLHDHLFATMRQQHQHQP